MPPKRKSVTAAKASRVSTVVQSDSASAAGLINASHTPLSNSECVTPLTATAAKHATLNPRARVLGLLGATATDLIATAGSMELDGASSSLAFRSARDCAAMLRAVYVVTQTDKAQLKLRPQELSNASLQSSLQMQPGILQGLKYAAGGPAPFAGVHASPSKTMHSGLQDYAGSRIGLVAPKGPLPTPPPSPSRFFAPPSDFASPTRPPHAASLGQDVPLFSADPQSSGVAQLTPTSTPTTASSGEPLNLAVFADQRWRSAVSMMIGDASVTIDQLARLAKLFPTYLRVSLSVPSALVDRSGAYGSANGRPASMYRIDEALRQLTEDAFGCGGVQSFSSLSQKLDDSSSRSEVLAMGRLRVTLLKPDVPSLDSLIADIQLRGGEGLVRSVDHDTALSLLASTATGSSAQLEPHRKRGRDSESPTPADSKQPDEAPSDVPACTVILPPHLLEVLSESKRAHVMQTVLVEQQALRDDQVHVLDRRVAWEKILGIYDLIRICFGAPVFDAQRNVKSYRQLGGAKLVNLLVAQNRYGCNKEEIALLLQRLLQFSESGLRISTISWGTDVHHATTTVLVEDQPSAGMMFGEQLPPRDDAFDAVLFHLSPAASRAKLEVALEEHNSGTAAVQ
jgi:hypothetical protein